MATAALTPRVRTIVICDDISGSVIKPDIFTLENVRLRLEATSFPHVASLAVYLLLSSPRKGRYPGKLMVVNERNDRPIRYVRFLATFPEDNKLLPLFGSVADCVFPEAGRYSFEVYFSAGDGDEALKGEHPFTLLLKEE